LLFPRTEAG
jgi:hypothetical protein